MKKISLKEYRIHSRMNRSFARCSLLNVLRKIHSLLLFFMTTVEIRCKNPHCFLWFLIYSILINLLPLLHYLTSKTTPDFQFSHCCTIDECVCQLHKHKDVV